jgi:hypothetical protein
MQSAASDWAAQLVAGALMQVAPALDEEEAPGNGSGILRVPMGTEQDRPVREVPAPIGYATL